MQLCAMYTHKDSIENEKRVTFFDVILQTWTVD